MALDPRLAVRVQFITGILSILFFLLIAFTCRCVGMNKLTKGLYNHKWFNKLYSYHCMFWWGLFISLVIHVILGIYIFGVPF